MRSGPRGPRLALLSSALGVALAFCLGGPALVRGEAAQGRDTADGGVRVRIEDVGLLDQDERELNFKAEVLADRVVVIDFVYTTCTTVCPVISAVLADVQAALGERLVRDARLVSITLDPTRDTPAVLKSYSENFSAAAGWLFLTGEKSDVDRVLVGLGAYTPDFTSHPPTVLIGDAARGVWTRLYGFVSPAEIEARIGALLEARSAAAPGAGTEKAAN